MKSMIWLVVCGLLPVVTFGEDSIIPEAARPFLVKIKEVAPAFGAAVNEQARRATFNDAMTRITELVDADVAAECKAREDVSIDCKIIAIAFDFKDNPESYRTIENEYLNAPIPPGRKVTAAGPQYPPLQPGHTTERFRLIWEYLLLRPEGESRDGRRLIDFYLNVVMGALVQIKAPQSQILYEYEFQSSFLKAGTAAADVEWRKLFSAMAVEPSEKSLSRLVRCMESARDVPKVYPAVQRVMLTSLLGIGVSWSDAFYRGVVSENDPLRTVWRQRRETWREAIQRLPKQDLSRDTRTILQQALDHPPL